MAGLGSVLIGAGAAAGRDVEFHIGPSHFTVFAWRREAARRVQECELPGQQTGSRSGTLKLRLSTTTSNQREDLIFLNLKIFTNIFLFIFF